MQQSPMQTPNSLYQRRNTKDLFKQLTTSFEFSKELSILILELHECSDIAELLSLFVLDDNLQYNHYFLPNSQDQNLAVCRVCEGNKSKHSNTSLSWQEIAKIQESLRVLVQHNADQRPTSFIYPRQQESLFRDQPPLVGQQDSVTCCICYKFGGKQDFLKIGLITHEVCFDCMSEYLKEQILNLKIDGMTCPHCEEKLTPDIVKEYVNGTLFQKYQTFSRNMQIQKNPNLKWCPNPKCSVIISVHSKKNTVKCPKCQTSVCLKCNQEAHPKQSCDKAIQKIFKDLENASDIQKCRKCKALVQKIAGCNHMTCRVCKYEWCWLCGSTYSDIHFSPLNPLGCAGMQNRSISGLAKCKMFVLRFFMIIGFVIISPIVIPLIMLFCGPVLLFNFLVKNIFRYPGCLGEVLIGLMSVPLGIAFDPFIWIGITAYFMPKLCSSIREWLQRRRNIIQGSENEIKRRLLEQSEGIVVSNE